MARHSGQHIQSSRKGGKMDAKWQDEAASEFRVPGKEEKMGSKRLTRREFLRGAAITGAGLVAAACAPAATPTETPPPEVMEVTKVVKETVVVEATPVPEPTMAPPAKDTIVVGMARPLSGPLAVIGDSAFRPVYETWVERVNADGGIYVEEYGKQLPIELIVYDDTSDPGTMTRLTEKLILEE
jgi:hypothetical protein